VNTTRRASSGGGTRSGGRTKRALIGRTAIRLALAIMLICLLALGTIIAIAGSTVDADIDQLQMQQGADLARALALAAAVAHTPAGWDREDLSPVIDLVKKAGVAVEIRSVSGQLIRRSPGYDRARSFSMHRVPVVDEGKLIGTVTLKFDGKGLGADIDRYNTLRWHIRAVAAAAAVLIGLSVSLLVSIRLTTPLDRLVGAVRAMGAGDSSVRIGKLRGVPEVRELSAAFDQMADSISAQQQSRRDMAADLAHELRAPIAVLQAGLESLQDGLAEPTPDYLGLLRSDVIRLAQMADDLRILASGHPAELKVEVATHDLAAIAAEAADSVAAAFAGANVGLNRRLTPVDVRADELRIGQVVVNLLSNAVKFTPAGGSVTLETGPAPSPRFAILRISDTGVGIAADDLPFVTQRFFRGTSGATVSGSGIGLAIVDQLVQLHHGHMEIESEPGRGTQVTVMLPRAEDATP
jgi:two-component system, OmpR family, sensor histidine kinase BaeS